MALVSPYIIIALKSITIYLFIILSIRLFGKKELSQLSVIDLVFILLISNSVQNAMVGNDTSVPGGMAAAIGLFICNYFFRLFLRKSKRFAKLVEGEKIILVHEGKVLENGMKQAQMTMDELEMAVREHGVIDVAHASLVVLEVDGNISVLSSNYSHKTVTRRKKPQLSHNP
jgi:uncharacterized membrane protein YcaP (DUF421 family)